MHNWNDVISRANSRNPDPPRRARFRSKLAPPWGGGEVHEVTSVGAT